MSPSEVSSSDASLTNRRSQTDSQSFGARCQSWPAIGDILASAETLNRLHSRPYYLRYPEGLNVLAFANQRGSAALGSFKASGRARPHNSANASEPQFNPVRGGQFHRPRLVLGQDHAHLGIGQRVIALAPTSTHTRLAVQLSAIATRVEAPT